MNILSNKEIAGGGFVISAGDPLPRRQVDFQFRNGVGFAVDELVDDAGKFAVTFAESAEPDLHEFHAEGLEAAFPLPAEGIQQAVDAVIGVPSKARAPMVSTFAPMEIDLMLSVPLSRQPGMLTASLPMMKVIPGSAEPAPLKGVYEV